MTRLGFQIPNSDLPDVPDAQLFERLAGMARSAEAPGFDSIFVMTAGPGSRWVRARARLS